MEQHIDCYWSSQDGYHFSFGKKRLWEGNSYYIVADLIDDTFQNHEKFSHLKDALSYLRTNKL